MRTEDLFDIKKQLEHWKERREMLLAWMETHESNHPDWDTNRRDLDVAVVKIEQLKNRNNHSTIRVPDTYSLPNFKH